MKTARIRNSNKKEDKKDINNEYSMKKMIIITIIIMAVFLAFYFVTDLIVEPIVEEDIDTPVVLDSSKITMGNLLNRKDSEYYVLATKNSLYSSSTNYEEIYNSYINDYNKKDNSLKFYKVDLDDALNKSYLSEELNITDDLSSLRLNDEVLFKIKDSKIENYYVGSKQIIEELSNL